MAPKGHSFTEDSAKRIGRVVRAAEKLGIVDHLDMTPPSRRHKGRGGTAGTRPVSFRVTIESGAPGTYTSSAPSSAAAGIPGTATVALGYIEHRDPVGNKYYAVAEITTGDSGLDDLLGGFNVLYVDYTEGISGSIGVVNASTETDALNLVDSLDTNWLQPLACVKMDGTTKAVEMIRVYHEGNIDATGMYRLPDTATIVDADLDAVTPEGGGSANADTWAIENQDSGESGVKLKLTTRLYYDHNASNPTLYGFYRTFTIDGYGRVVAIGEENIYTVDPTDECDA